VAIKDKVQDLLNKKRYRAYMEMFSPDGLHSRVVLKDMCAAHHVFDAGFDSDPIELARMAAERNVVLRILTILKLKPEDIVDLAKED